MNPILNDFRNTRKAQLLQGYIASYCPGVPPLSITQALAVVLSLQSAGAVLDAVINLALERENDSPGPVVHFVPDIGGTLLPTAGFWLPLRYWKSQEQLQEAIQYRTNPDRLLQFLFNNADDPDPRLAVGETREDRRNTDRLAIAANEDPSIVKGGTVWRITEAKGIGETEIDPNVDLDQLWQICQAQEPSPAP